jgi:MFS family permease
MSAVVTTAARTARTEKPFALTVCAAMIAGACTFLNVYCTQPVLPYFQNLFHATEFAVSLTVSVVTLAVAITAPFVGLFAETIGRKKVIVPALFGMALTTLLTATATTLPALIFWRFMQGLCVPGVIAVIIAYINEEFPGRTGTVMAAYVSGTVFGGFLGRFLTGLIATHGNWRMAFVVLGVLNLLGAFAVRQWLPPAVNFVPAKHVFRSLGDTWGHLTNPRLLAVCGMGFTILFSLVGVFTYANFHLSRAPFNLGPAGLGGIFFVYLLGCIVTPLAGRFLDRHGFRRTTFLSVAASLAGLALTLSPSLPLVIAGLAVFSSGIFVSQSSATGLTGQVAGRARSAAAGLYVTFYYAGGSIGTMVAAWFWVKGGWPACVGLFAAVSLGTLGFAFLGGRSVADDKASAGPLMDTAI